MSVWVYEMGDLRTMNIVVLLCPKAELEKSLREKSEKEEALASSRRSLHEQSLQLAGTRAELAASAKENQHLRRSLEQLKDQVEDEECEIAAAQDESLMRKLVETELESQEAGRLASALRDQVRALREPRKTPSAAESCGLQRARDQLVTKLADFEESNVQLRRLLRQRHEDEARRGRLTDQRDLLLSELRRQVEQTRCLESEVASRDRRIDELASQLAQQRDDNVYKVGHVSALESTRAHLQQQLRQREADCNRMAVQIRSLESQLAQEKIDNGQLTELLRDSKDRLEREKESLKKATRWATLIEDDDVVLRHTLPVFTGLGRCPIVSWDFAGAVSIFLDRMPFLSSTNDFYQD